MKLNTIDLMTDVLVIGAGGAGIRAALEAAKENVNVILCSKGEVYHSSTTGHRIVDLAGFNAATDEGENTCEAYYHDIMNAAAGTADPNLVKILSEEAILEQNYLASIGVPFERNMESGQYVISQACFASRRRMFIIPGHGHSIIHSLMNQIKKHSKIRIMEYLTITRLTRRNGKIVGAVGLDKNGDINIIKAKAVVVAAGGAGSLFRLNMNPEQISGDSYFLLSDAGATLTNMEFMQFGLGTIYPNYNLIGNWLYPVLPVFRDARGEELLSKYAPAGTNFREILAEKVKHFPFSTQDISKYIEISVHKKILSGNTTEHGGVTLDFTGVTEKNLNSLPDHMQHTFKMAKAWLKSRGIDIEKQGAEVATFAHAINGGAIIDGDAATDVPGLFAAGECASGPHGSDRLGGNMLVTSQVFGRRAGKAAAAFARQVEHYQGDDYMGIELENILRVSNQKEKSEFEYIEQLNDFKKSMWKNMVVVRSNQGIGESMVTLREVSEHLSNKAPHNVQELKIKLEISRMLHTANILLNVALKRKESRGSHYREDFPERNDKAFELNLFLKNDGETIQMKKATIEEYRKKGFKNLDDPGEKLREDRS